MISENVKQDCVAFVSKPRVFKVLCYDNPTLLARHILDVFWTKHPENRTMRTSCMTSHRTRTT